MPDAHDQVGLSGFRVLVVEDSLIVADTIADHLVDLGCLVVGPVGGVASASELAANETFDAALLDINLNGELSFPIATILRGRGIPFAFMTGYGEDALPGDFRGEARLAKPFRAAALEGVLQQFADHRFDP